MQAAIASCRRVCDAEEPQITHGIHLYRRGLFAVAVPAALGWYLAVRLIVGGELWEAEDLGLGRAGLAVVALLLQLPLALYVAVGHWTGVWSLLWSGG